MAEIMAVEGRQVVKFDLSAREYNRYCKYLYGDQANELSDLGLRVCFSSSSPCDVLIMNSNFVSAGLMVNERIDL